MGNPLGVKKRPPPPPQEREKKTDQKNLARNSQAKKKRKISFKISRTSVNPFTQGLAFFAKKAKIEDLATNIGKAVKSKPQSLTMKKERNHLEK
jgi:hypothetical protein